MDFSELNLSPPLQKALREEKYCTPTPIQEQAIPPILQGRDFLGCAQTGTGKTAAFALPILELLGEKVPRTSGVRPIRALILTPTRELALQIHESFSAYGRHLPLRSCVIYGGVSQVPQVTQLKRGVDILTATPGRLNDLVNQGYIDLSKIEIFVLDEADRMLDMGFINDVKRIISYLPPKKQTLLFSATMPGEIVKLVDSLLVNPAKVSVTPSATTVEIIEQSVYFVDKTNKRNLLAHLLATEEIHSALVFTRTKHGADRVVTDLTRAKVSAKAIHGDKSQNARQSALNSFKTGGIRVLVATDIAARGIDIEELPFVINYDLPNISETYVHRIGRTGRAGQSGRAISFCDISEKPYLADIEKLTRQKVPVVEGHPFPMEVFTPPEKQERPPRKSRIPGEAKPPRRGSPAGGGQWGAPKKGGASKNGASRSGGRQPGRQEGGRPFKKGSGQSRGR